MLRPRSRRRPVRLKIIALLVAPLVSIVALWAFAAVLTIGDAQKKQRTDTLSRIYGGPITGLTAQLSAEGLASALARSNPSDSNLATLVKQRLRTDAAVAAVRAADNSPDLQNAAPDDLKAAFRLLSDRLDGLASVRTAVDSGRVTVLDTVNRYGDLYGAADANANVFTQDVFVGVKDYAQTLPLFAENNASDYIGREEGLLLGTLENGAVSLSTTETLALGQFVAGHRLLLDNAAAQTDPTLGTGSQQTVASPAYRQLTAIEDQILRAPAGTPISVDAATVRTAADTVRGSVSAAFLQTGLAASRRAAASGRPIILRVELAGLFGIVALVVSVVLSVRLGRGLTRELTQLRTAARQLADEQLPSVIQRLRDDVDVDVAAEVPPLKVGTTTEIAEVGEAFGTVQRTAVDAAVSQANLRRGVRQVFLNLARRSQSLLHRQLTMLDAMERKAADPEALEELFRLDHLTTRMRRHAEGLIILSGALPARAWTTPVPVVDVVRAAVAEVESYVRVRVYVKSEASFSGTAVADLTHLFAELVENAASFSPPHTQVQVRADSVANGVVVEIEDAGLGMSPDQLNEINDRLATPPGFDVADSDRLGLFVVAQLAARHQIRVTLRPSPYGGITAIALVPGNLVVVDAIAERYQDTIDERAWSRGGQRGSVRADASARPGAPGRDNGVGAAGNGAIWPVSAGGDPDGSMLPGRHRRLASYPQAARDQLALESSTPAAGSGRRPEQTGQPDQTGRREQTGRPDRNGQPERPAGPVPTGWPQLAGWAALPPAGRTPAARAATGTSTFDIWAAGEATSRAASAAGPGSDGPAAMGEPATTGAGTEPAAAARPAAAAGPAGAAPEATADAGSGALSESSTGSAVTESGLPRRVRRASLATKLRNPPDPTGQDVEADRDEARPPEQARAVFASLQSGWQRGRSAADLPTRPDLPTPPMVSELPAPPAVSELPAPPAVSDSPARPAVSPPVAADQVPAPRTPLGQPTGTAAGPAAGTDRGGHPDRFGPARPILSGPWSATAERSGNRQGSVDGDRFGAGHRSDAANRPRPDPADGQRPDPASGPGSA